jgi:hypothetical protein
MSAASDSETPNARPIVPTLSETLRNEAGVILRAQETMGQSEVGVRTPRDGMCTPCPTMF